jgi:anti-sigma factor RsiW
MSCIETQPLIDGYVDGELDLVRNLEIERHLQECTVCSQMQQNQLTLRAAIRSPDLYFKPPVNLQQRIQSALREVESVSSEVDKVAAKPLVATPRMDWRWLAVAASLAFIAILTWTLVRKSSVPPTNDLVAQEVIASHVRSMMANHLTDVPSTDQHTVKPWFNGKLDFSPAVLDLTKQGFPLVGGRLDYLDNRPVAALVYQRRQHFINLFIWLSTNDSESGNKIMTRQGYNLIRWNKSGMIYWAISDLNLSELQQFAQAVQSPT